MLPDEISGIPSALHPRYEVIRLIGTGGTSYVLLGRDVSLKRDVAIKVLRPDLVDGVPVQRFLREIRTTARLEHPSILPLLDAGESGRFMYYVMPYVRGESLRDVLAREGPLPVKRAIDIGRRVARALDYAHRQGVIHRDVKPGNILVSDGDPLVADFGLSRAIEVTGEDEALTRSGVGVGTPHYMSPEQTRGSGRIDSRTDTYSLGCVLFEMLAGDPPFLGSTAQAVALRKLVEDPPSLRTVRPSVSPDLEQLISKALQRSPADRFSTTGEFADALDQLRAGDDLRTPRQVAAHQVDSTAARSHAVWRRTLSGVAIALAALVLIAGGKRLINRVPYTEHVLRTPAVLAAWQPIAWSTATGFDQYIWLPRGTSFSFDPRWIWSSGDTTLFVDPTFTNLVSSFDGSTWSMTPLFSRNGDVHPPQQLGDSLLFLSSAGVSARLTGSGFLPWAAPPSDVVEAIWSDGRSLVLAGTNARIHALRDGVWTRETSATLDDVIAIWGSRSAALGALVNSDRDPWGESVIRKFGIAWRTDPTIPQLEAPEFGTGTTLGDGSEVLVGRECGDRVQCVPLLLVRNGASWRRMGLGSSSDMMLLGAWGDSHADFYVWGRPIDGEPDACGPTPGCLTRIVSGKTVERTTFESTYVVGMGSLHGRIYLLTGDGRLWARGDEGWLIVTRVPGFGFMEVAADPAIGPVAIVGPDLVVGSGLSWLIDPTYTASLPNVPGLPVVRPIGVAPPEVRLVRTIAARDSVVWASVEPAGVFRGQCRSGSEQGWSCESVRVSAVPAVDFAFLETGAAIWVSEDHAIHIYEGGASRSLPVPREADGDPLRAVVGLGGDSLLIVADSSLLLGTPDLLTAIPRPCRRGCGGTPKDVVLAGGFVAVSTTRGSENRLEIFPLSPPRSVVAALHEVPGHSWADPPFKLHALEDGRLILGFGVPDDASIPGWLELWSPPFSTTTPTRVEVPLGGDVAGLASDDVYLYVVGSNWMAHRIPIDSLPG